MKIIFVCRGNVARSYIASELFKKYSQHETLSAGTKLTHYEGSDKMIKDLPLTDLLIETMKEKGIDLSQKIRTLITPEIARKADCIIMMAEPETIPDYLKNNPKVIYWEIEDPKGKDKKFYKKTIEEIERKIKEFVKEKGL